MHTNFNEHGVDKWQRVKACCYNMYRAYGTLLSLMFMRNGLKPVVTKIAEPMAL